MLVGRTALAVGPFDLELELVVIPSHRTASKTGEDQINDVQCRTRIFDRQPRGTVLDLQLFRALSMLQASFLRCGIKHR